VDYVIIYVADLHRSIDFYRDVVGLPFKFEGDGYVEFATTGCKFALYERTKLAELIGRNMVEGDGPQGEVAFIVDDVDTESKRLRRAGVMMLSGPQDRPWGHRTIHFLDPDGFVVEFAQEIPRGRPGAGA